MSYEPKPTPPSGMPAASLLERARPSDDEIAAPKSERTIAILEAISASEHRSDARLTAFESRSSDRFDAFEGRVEHRLQALEKDIRDVDHRATERSAEHAANHTKLIGAVTKAIDLSLEAKKQSSDAVANTQTVVESALRIHGSSIAIIVNEAAKKAVDSAVAPLATEMLDIKADGEGRAKEIGKVTEALGAVVEELGIADEVQLGQATPRGEPKPERTMAKVDRIDRRFKSSTIVQVVIAVGIVAEALMKVLGLH